MAKKFNCTFSVRETTERTYVVTNLPIDVSNEDLEGVKVTKQSIEDIVSDKIYDLLQGGELTLDGRISVEGTLIQTDNNFDCVKFVQTPKEIEE